MVRRALVPLAALLGAAEGSPPPGTCAARRTKSPDGAAAKAWGSIDSECRRKLEANRTADAMRCLEGHFLEGREPGRRGGDFLTTLRKLRHDAEMFTWLEQEGRIKPEVKKLYRGVWHAARSQHLDRPDKVFEVSFHDKKEDRDLWEKTNSKSVYVDPAGQETPRRTVWAAPAAFQAVEAGFRERGYAVVDRLLAEPALKKLRRFLQASTFYFYPRRDRHLVALLEDGLASPLLGQISDGLRLSLPSVLGPLPLTGARAWKADNSALAGGEPQVPDLANSSADAAASVLLWTVPASALNGSAAGALALRRRRSDGALSSASASEADDEGLLSSVKYLSNRAILWGPGVAAEWTGPGWRGGFLNRGLHLLLTFGWTRCEA